MDLFDFVVNNADLLEQIYANHKGEITLDPDSFDFSHKDLQAETEGSKIVFTVEAGGLKLICNIDIDNMADAIKHMKNIKDLDLRVTVLEAFEDSYREDAEAIVNEKKTELDDAQQGYDDAKKDFDLIVDSITDLKGSWNIP